MPSLRELQSHVRDAVVLGNADAVAPLLIGGARPRNRLLVHHRHYEASLIATLMQRFPATVWLVGSAFVTEAARRFVMTHPPRRPCVAEYGRDFPAFLASQPHADQLPYLGDFAELEGLFGEVAIEVSRPPVSASDIIELAGRDLSGTGVLLQPGLRFLRASWPVDELLTLYLTDSAPDRFDLSAGEARLQVRGARGDVDLARLSPGDFAFRAALADGVAIDEAASQAGEEDGAFDPTDALTALVGDGLITAFLPPATGSTS